MIEVIDRKDRFTPEFLNPRIESDWARIKELSQNQFIEVVDRIKDQIADLVKINHPQKSFSQGELQKEIEDFLPDQNLSSYGNWFFFPWKNSLVHVLPEEEFIKVRTIRNNYKITPSEQKELGKKVVGVVGLSVGQSVSLVMSLERSCGELRLADFDSLELSNLNRIKAGVTDLGRSKIIIAAREISEIDPYLKLTLYKDGINENNVENFLTDGGKMDLLIDECDSFDIKILLREKARRHKVPVLMDTSDRGMMDVERFDLEPDREIFHGKLGDFSLEDLKSLSATQKVAFGLRITGIESLSPRMKASLLEIGQTITSWPQLASGVFLGGASVAHVGRKILLGEKINSGRYFIDFEDLIPVNSEKIDSEHHELGLNSSDSFDLPNLESSTYSVSNSELKHIIEVANLAPSGGNVQPWIWVFDRRKGNLHLFHDLRRSFSLLDYKGTGSLISFGAALENIRLICSQKGIKTEEIYHPDQFNKELIASIRFVSKSGSPLPVEDFELVDGIKIRCTNRKNTSKKELSKEQLNRVLDYGNKNGFELSVVSDESMLNKLVEVVGGMDRMRLFHEQGLADFIKEIRWTASETLKTKDGIDIETLELSGAEKAAMGLLKDPRTLRFFREYFLGYGLTRISKNSIVSSSGVFLLRGKNFCPKVFLDGGKIIQKIWIWANLNGLSFQPISASLFLFHRVLKENQSGFSEVEKNEILKLKEEFNLIFKEGNNKEEIFMFRLNFAGEPSARSLRRDVSETLKILS